MVYFEADRIVVKISMKKFFAPNITMAGRVARAIWGLGLIAAGLLLFRSSKWACVVFMVFGVFALYEAARGWCIMRACGIKTRM